jgi:hypothetical protein
MAEAARDERHRKAVAIGTEAGRQISTLWWMSKANLPASADFSGLWTGQAPRRNMVLCHAAPTLPGLLASRILSRRLRSVELSRPSMLRIWYSLWKVDSSNPIKL